MIKRIYYSSFGISFMILMTGHYYHLRHLAELHIQPRQHRPVTLTCIQCKCFENLMRKHVCRHFREHGLLYNAQHGFLKGRLGLLKLLNLLSEVIDKLDERKIVKVCYLHSFKAFD